MKNFVRVICLVLASLFCLLAIVACDNNKGPGREKNNVNVKVDENGVRWAEDEWGVWREYDNLPDDLDYNDTISFLHWETGGTVLPEFVQTEEVDDARLSSIYKRNKAIESRLGVTLNFISEPVEGVVARVSRAKDSGTNDFDIIATKSVQMGKLMMVGLLQNMSATENNHIEMSKPWWPVNLAHNMAIRGNIFFLSGDCSTNAIDQMNCIYYNKDNLNEKYEQDALEYFSKNEHVKTPEDGDDGGDTASNMVYEKVYAGKWTLDDFIYLASDCYIDKKGDGVTVDDTYGLSTRTGNIASLYTSSNLRMIETSMDDTVLKISDDWTSTKTVRLVAKLNTLLSTSSYCKGNFLNGGKAYYQTPFYNGTGFFSLHNMRQAEQNLVNNDKVENYGVLPTPKYDLAQKHYYTAIGAEFSIYAIFSDFDKRGNEQQTLSMLTAVIECWGSEAYRKTTPVIFELNLKLKASPTQCEADMCEIIRASIEFDLGRVLQAQLAGSADGAFGMDNQMAAAAESGTPWVSQYGPKIESCKANLAAFVEQLKQTLVEV